MVQIHSEPGEGKAIRRKSLRRVNHAIYILTTGARESAFRNVKTIAECLADKLINAAKGLLRSRRVIFSGVQVTEFDDIIPASAATIAAGAFTAATINIHFIWCIVGDQDFFSLPIRA
ncbi:hypothetical protein POM88_005073 [Heracleum sosnowskyi]|uniref:Small ribosomal subunit protein uS7 domain-containing protein n=1 Tax=Heracleum sosnowskyi TaxID=360622 RepID=A0AAD8NEZ9_9APIA|nr:hypothetical protein POM88_005073 [Heracleum sosnowskyi]